MSTKQTTQVKKKFNASMFEKIKDSLNKPTESSGGSFANILKFPAGHTYTLRLIPNLENLDKTFYHYFVHNWTSKSTGSFISALSLQTVGERDPIAEARWKLYKSEKQSDKDLSQEIERKEHWLVNVYVVEDPSNSDNNGTVKMFRIGPQIKKIIDDAMNGDGAEEFGPRIFDLGPDGVNLKIKAEKQDKFTTFQASRFSAVPKSTLSDEEIEKIYESVHDLESVQPVKTREELEALLAEHFFCNGVTAPTVTKRAEPRTQVPTADDVNDDIPFEFPSKDDEEGGFDFDTLLAGTDTKQ